MKTAIIIPTFNAGPNWPKNLDACLMQENVKASDILVIDSSSDDKTFVTTQEREVPCLVIPRNEFSHGGTRNRAAALFPEHEVLVFLTQDATLATPTSIQQLVRCFENAKTAIAFGRHIPRADAHPIERHARYFNYPEHERTCCPGNASKYGIKAIFTSNTFCAYRNSTFRALGGFAETSIISEDMEFAARAMRKGHCIHYNPSACVIHSHTTHWTKDFSRYFEIGMFHQHHKWIQRHFGSNQNEGIKYASSLARYLTKHAPHTIPYALMNLGNRWLAYQLGKHHNILPSALVRKISNSSHLLTTTKTPS